MAVTHRTYVDWDNLGTLPLSATDESAYVRLAAAALTCDYGRDQARSYTPPKAGKSSWVFDNSTSRFSSLNPSSLLYGKLNPGVLVQHSMTISNTAAGYAETVLNDLPVLYYRLDEIGGQVLDSSGNALFGTRSGTTTPGQTGALGTEPGGWSDYAMLLNAPTGSITTTHSSLLNVGDTFSLEFWIKISALPAADVTLLSKGTGAFQVKLTTGGAIVLAKNGTADIVTSTVNLAAGSYYHIVITKSGATVKIWINKTDRTGVVSNQTCINTSTDLTICILTGATIDVTLDELAIYGTALSSSRVTVHYDGGLTQSSSDLSSTYRFHTGNLDLPQQLPGIIQQMVMESTFDGLTFLKQAVISTAEYVNQPISVLIGACLDAAGWPTALRNIETAATTVVRWAVDGVTAFNAIRDLTFTEGANSMFYIDPHTGFFTWENRYHRFYAQRSITAQCNAKSQGAEPIFGIDFMFDDGVRNIVNSCTVPVYTYTPGSLAVVWTGPTSLTLAPGEVWTRTVSTSALWFTGAVTPSAGTDYTLVSGSVTPSLSRTSGKRATLTMTAGASGASITGLQMRAQPVTLTDTVYVTNSNSGASASGVNYGTKTLPDEFIPSWIPDTATAQDYTNYIVARYKDPVYTCRFVLNNDNETRLLLAMQVKVSDRVKVTEPLRAFIDDDFFVEQISDNVGIGTNHSRVFGCEMANNQAFWILGITGYSELGVTTRLGY